MPRYVPPPEEYDWRYTAEQRREIVDFVFAWDQENGRGGRRAAKKRFGTTTSTINQWIRSEFRHLVPWGGWEQRRGVIARMIEIADRIEELEAKGEDARRERLEILRAVEAEHR